MFLQSITLRQFRNHRDLELTVDPGVNLFLGPNGAGKTNVIEAAAVLATGLSPRGADPESMVPWGEEGFAIKALFSYDEPGLDPITLEMKYRSGSRRVIRQNEKIEVRLKDLLGRVPLVSFVPEDLAMVKGEPDVRRRAVDMVLVQTDPAYAEALRRYKEALKSRNAALRQLADNAIDRDALLPWDDAVIEAGLVVCAKRAAFLDDFSARVNAIQDRVSGGRESIQILYRPSFEGPWDESGAAAWKAALRRNESMELATGSTSVGPHRDDLSFMLNGRPARQFASEGQKRTCAVAFKLAEIPYVQEKLGQKPICLLDDVLSELDARRAEHLLHELSRTGQCFVTMT
ncbi:MAG: DNA replication/repair protein RecF, partial [Elusimicrobia bacterium]|nr:DNA replication/repair protein RecF [Elusimicrobiota bacterium]